MAGCHEHVDNQHVSQQSQEGREALFLLVYTEVTDAGRSETKLTYWNQADQAVEVVVNTGTIALFQGEARYYRHRGQTGHADTVKRFMRIGGNKLQPPPGSFQRPLNLDPSAQQCHSKEVGDSVLGRITGGFGTGRANDNFELHEMCEGHFVLSWCNTLHLYYATASRKVLASRRDSTWTEIEQDNDDYFGCVPRACSCLLRVLATAWYLCGRDLDPAQVSSLKFKPFQLRKWLHDVCQCESIVDLMPPTTMPVPPNAKQSK